MRKLILPECPPELLEPDLEGDGPQLVNDNFSCEGCNFHFSMPKENAGSVYQIHFCSFERTMKNRISDRYIGRNDETPEWCPILEAIED